MSLTPEIVATLPALTDEQKAKANQLIECLKHTIDLLDNIPADRLAEALTTGSIEHYFDVHIKRRKLWNTIYQQIATDIEASFASLERSRHVAVDCISVARKAAEAFGSKEFKESINNLQQFINLCNQFHQLQESGILAKVFAVTGHEVPAT